MTNMGAKRTTPAAGPNVRFSPIADIQAMRESRMMRLSVSIVPWVLLATVAVLIAATAGLLSWPYAWDVRDDDITISIKNGMDATFKGKFEAVGGSFSGGWRPNPGADETINAPLLLR